jgi:hypothetical protein
MDGMIFELSQLRRAICFTEQLLNEIQAQRRDE